MQEVSTDDCWLWAHRVTKWDYGLMRLNIDGKRPSVYGHRLFYEAYKGEIPKGYEVDHLCFTPRCINPDHLEAVTKEENLRRKRAAHKPYNITKRFCTNGHEYTPENTLIDSSKTGWRRCRTCKSIKNRKQTLKRARARAL